MATGTGIEIAARRGGLRATKAPSGMTPRVSRIVCYILKAACPPPLLVKLQAKALEGSLKYWPVLANKP